MAKTQIFFFPHFIYNHNMITRPDYDPSKSNIFFDYNQSLRFVPTKQFNNTTNWYDKIRVTDSEEAAPDARGYINIPSIALPTWLEKVYTKQTERRRLLVRSLGTGFTIPAVDKFGNVILDNAGNVVYQNKTFREILESPSPVRENMYKYLVNTRSNASLQDPKYSLMIEILAKQFALPQFNTESPGARNARLARADGGAQYGAAGGFPPWWQGGPSGPPAQPPGGPPGKPPTGPPKYPKLEKKEPEEEQKEPKQEGQAKGFFGAWGDFLKKKSSEAGTTLIDRLAGLAGTISESLPEEPRVISSTIGTQTSPSRRTPLISTQTQTIEDLDESKYSSPSVSQGIMDEANKFYLNLAQLRHLLDYDQSLMNFDAETRRFRLLVYITTNLAELSISQQTLVSEFLDNIPFDINRSYRQRLFQYQEDLPVNITPEERRKLTLDFLDGLTIHNYSYGQPTVNADTVPITPQMFSPQKPRSTTVSPTEPVPRYGPDLPPVKPTYDDSDDIFQQQVQDLVDSMMEDMDEEKREFEIKQQDLDLQEDLDLQQAMDEFIRQQEQKAAEKQQRKPDEPASREPSPEEEDIKNAEEWPVEETKETKEEKEPSPEPQMPENLPQNPFEKPAAPQVQQQQQDLVDVNGNPIVPPPEEETPEPAPDELKQAVSEEPLTPQTPSSEDEDLKMGEEKKAEEKVSEPSYIFPPQEEWSSQTILNNMELNTFYDLNPQTADRDAKILWKVLFRMRLGFYRYLWRCSFTLPGVYFVLFVKAKKVLITNRFEAKLLEKPSLEQPVIHYKIGDNEGEDKEIFACIYHAENRAELFDGQFRDWYGIDFLNDETLKIADNIGTWLQEGSIGIVEMLFQILINNLSTKDALFMVYWENEIVKRLSELHRRQRTNTLDVISEYEEIPFIRFNPQYKIFELGIIDSIDSTGSIEISVRKPGFDQSEKHKINLTMGEPITWLTVVFIDSMDALMETLRPYTKNTFHASVFYQPSFRSTEVSQMTTLPQFQPWLPKLPAAISTFDNYLVAFIIEAYKPPTERADSLNISLERVGNPYGSNLETLIYIDTKSDLTFAWYESKNLNIVAIHGATLDQDYFIQGGAAYFSQRVRNLLGTDISDYIKKLNTLFNVALQSRKKTLITSHSLGSYIEYVTLYHTEEYESYFESICFAPFVPKITQESMYFAESPAFRKILYKQDYFANTLLSIPHRQNTIVFDDPAFNIDILRKDSWISWFNAHNINIFRNLSPNRYIMKLNDHGMYDFSILRKTIPTEEELKERGEVGLSPRRKKRRTASPRHEQKENE